MLFCGLVLIAIGVGALFDSSWYWPAVLIAAGMAMVFRLVPCCYPFVGESRHYEKSRSGNGEEVPTP